MPSSVLTDVATMITELARLVPAPVAPLAYGTEIACGTELDANMGEVDPNSVEAIGMALQRRLITAAGTLWDDPDYGEDIRGFLNRATTADDLRDLSGRVRNEIVKDDRVEVASVRVAMAGTSLSIGATVTPVNAALGVFTLTFALTDATLALQEIRRGS
jgi:hypothetical protein